MMLCYVSSLQHQHLKKPSLLQQPLLSRPLKQPLLPRLLEQLPILELSQSAATYNPPIIPQVMEQLPCTLVIIVVAVVIILVVIVVGVIILVVLFRAKKKKQKLVLSQLQNVTGEKEIGKLKQDKTNGKGVSSKPEQPLYAVVQKKARSRSEDVDQTCTLSEYKMVPAGCEYALTATFPRVVNLTNPMFEEMESNPIYQSMNQCHDPPCTTNVPQGDDVSNVPDVISSHTVETKSGTHETVYSEPIQPSLFMVAAGNPSDSEDLQPYAPIY